MTYLTGEHKKRKTLKQSYTFGTRVASEEKISAEAVIAQEALAFNLNKVEN